MHPLELKIPPPVVALIVAAAMWMNSISGPKLDLPFEVRLGIAVAIAVVGVTFDLLGLFAFRKARTTINPLKPQKTSALVTSGIYRFSRNPMYVGLVGLLLAWAAYLQALWPLAGPILFVFYINRFQIEPEERLLAQRFGEEYKSYKARVRRWL
jgi:protein-S-isoprenylcysteine O-methyltransferase Ste14